MRILNRMPFNIKYVYAGVKPDVILAFFDIEIMKTLLRGDLYGDSLSGDVLLRPDLHSRHTQAPVDDKYMSLCVPLILFCNGIA